MSEGTERPRASRRVSSLGHVTDSSLKMTVAGDGRRIRSWQKNKMPADSQSYSCGGPQRFTIPSVPVAFVFIIPNYGFQGQTLVWALALSLLSCVVRDKALDLSEPCLTG